MPTPQLKPTFRRFQALDALRGFGVLGIFVINIIGFSMPLIAFSNPWVAGGNSAIDHGLWSLTTILVEGSMRGLFSLMFGAGIFLFTVRAMYPDGPIRIADLYYRRTLWLVAFGVAHAYLLIMPGDILLTYGLAGLILFPFRVLPARRLAQLAMVLLIGVVAYTIPIELAQSRLEQAAARDEAELATVTRWEELYADNWPTESELQATIESHTGSMSEVYSSNANIVTGTYNVPDLLWGIVDAMIMMLLGLAFCKWGVVTGERRLSIYLRLMVVGYVIGIAFRSWAVLNVWETNFSPGPWVWESFDQIGRMAMTLGHLGLFFTLWKFFSGSLPMRALAATGRMALSNYIGQTVIANLIFSGVGFGLYGTLPRSQVYGVMLAIWLTQLTVSLLWLKRFRFGPLEWVWRCLTYGRLDVG